MLYYLVQSNFVVLALVVFSLVFLLTSRTLDKREKRIFLIANIFVLILVFADSVDSYLKSKEELNYARYISSAIGYTLRPGVIFLVVYNLRNRRTGEKKYTYIPFLVNGIMAFLSIFNGLVFWFDEENQFHRGILGILPFVTCFIYLFILIARVAVKHHITNKKEYAVLYVILFFAVVATAFEVKFKFDFLDNGILAISLIFFYFFLYIERMKKDPMTNAFNRQTYNLDILSLANKRFIVVSVDINNLKTINDRKGHDEGDKAIMGVAESIMKNLKYGCYFYRIGGDEFIILCPGVDRTTIESMMEQCEQDAKQLKYEFSWGMAEYSPGMDYGEVYRLSDTNMYEMKRKKQ